MVTAVPMTPARRRALAIGVPLAVALIGWTGFNAVAWAGQGSLPVTDRIPVRGGQVNMAVPPGNVALRPVSGGSARVTGTLHYSLIRPRLAEYQTANGTRVSYGCPVPAGVCSIDAAAGVPPRTAVTVSGDGDDLTATGISGNVTLSSTGGNVRATGLSGDLRLTTTGGGIRGIALAAPDVTAGSNGGDITLTFTLPPRNLRISALGGNITVVLPQGATQYDIAAHATGGQATTGGVPQVPSSVHQITATTTGGDITITEAR